MSQETDRKLERLFREVMNLDSKLDLEDLTQHDVSGWDSLRHADLTLRVQSLFRIRFRVAEVLTMNSYKRLRELVREKTRNVTSS